MYFNSEKDGWITKQFLDEVVKNNKEHYLQITGFTTMDEYYEDKLTTQTIINYMWSKLYKLVNKTHLGNISCLEFIFERR